MATSSITKNFIIEGTTQAEMFVKAIEDSLNNPTPRTKVNYTMIDTPEQLMELMAKRKK